MWTSVPQIDATFTRIRTSVGPSDGIGTVRISVLFGAGFDFTAAFMVDAIPNFPRTGPLMDPGYFNFLSFPSFGLEAGFLAALPVTVGPDATSMCGSRQGRTGTRAIETPRRGLDLPCRPGAPASRRVCSAWRRRSRSGFRCAGARAD